MLALVVALLAAFPDDVVIPTPTEAIGIDQLYAVRDGKLWLKEEGRWSLFKETGRVPGSAHAIVAVFADEKSHFMVVTDDGFLHHHENDVWDSLWGLPQLPVGRAPLKLPVSLDEGRIAYSMRRDHALYYEDIHGTQFNWGDVGCTSIYVLADDDTRILFADPWVPPDFSREVCGPERGSVRIASLAASASVLFVLAKNGEMWTRFDDYDHNGGTPLFRYSYDPRVGPGLRAPPSLPGADYWSGVQVHALPSHGWRKQPAIGARISRRIAIVQNGQGNDARELRVVGEGGLYTKQVDDAAWRFTKMDLPVDDDDWIDPAFSARTEPRALAFAGVLRGSKSLGHVYATTSDFSFHCSPFHLTLSVGAAQVKLVAHAVDDWTVFTHENPIDDDTAPKLLKLTLQLENDQQLDARTRARVDEIFAGNLGKTFAFVGVANQHELVIAPLGYPFTAARSRWQLVMRSDPREQGRRVAKIKPASKLAAGKEPCAALRAIRDQRADIERRLALFSGLEVAVPGGSAVVDTASIATTLRYTWDIVGIGLSAFELHLPAVMAAPALAYSRWLDASREDFERTERALKTTCRE